MKGICKCGQCGRTLIHFDRSRLTAFTICVSGADEPTIISRTGLFGDGKNLLDVVDHRRRLAGFFAPLVSTEGPSAVA